MLTPQDNAALAEAAKKWRRLGWLQLALVPLFAWFGVEGWAWELWVPAFIFAFTAGVPSGSRFSVTVLFVFAVLTLLGFIIGIIQEEGSVSGFHLNHVREFAQVYVVETSLVSMSVVWRRRRTAP